MAHFRTSVSFEFDLKPVLTVTAEIDRDTFEAAFKTAIYQAQEKYPRVKPRSMVCVVEEIPA